MSKLYRHLSDIKNMYLIKKSGYFDSQYYKNEYPNVRGNLLKHYYYLGYKMGYNPSNKFNNNYYLKKNPDVNSAMINPLLHYLICGKKEERNIFNDNGFSIGELYNNFYGEKYCYELYKTRGKIERINVFIDGISKYKFKEMVHFFHVITKKCSDNNAVLRLFYTNINFELIKKVLASCEKTKMINISYTLISDNYLLEFKENEINFCIDFSSMYALVNTMYMDFPIYYLINDYDKMEYEKKALLSLLVKSGKVRCLSFGTLKLREYKLKVLANKKISINNVNSLCIEFNDLFILGVEIINTYFSNKNYSIDFYYRIKDIYEQRKFFLDNNIVISPIGDQKVNYMIRFLDKIAKDNEDNFIDVYVEESNKVIDYINFLDNNIDDKLDVVVKDNDNKLLDALFDNIFIEGEE